MCIPAGAKYTAIDGVSLLYGEYRKAFCRKCYERCFDTIGEDKWDKYKKWINCYWCGNFCWLSDYCNDCEEYHCEYCSCRAKEIPCIICGDIGIYCECEKYDEELGRYDKDATYKKTIKHYPLC